MELTPTYVPNSPILTKPPCSNAVVLVQAMQHPVGDFWLVKVSLQQPPQWVNSELHQQYCWHTSELIHAGRSSLRRACSLPGPICCPICPTPSSLSLLSLRWTCLVATSTHEKALAFPPAHCCKALMALLQQ